MATLVVGSGITWFKRFCIGMVQIRVIAPFVIAVIVIRSTDCSFRMTIPGRIIPSITGHGQCLCGGFHADLLVYDPDLWQVMACLLALSLGVFMKDTKGESISEFKIQISKAWEL